MCLAQGWRTGTQCLSLFPITFPSPPVTSPLSIRPQMEIELSLPAPQTNHQKERHLEEAWSTLLNLMTDYYQFYFPQISWTPVWISPPLAVVLGHHGISRVEDAPAKRMLPIAKQRLYLSQPRQPLTLQRVTDYFTWGRPFSEKDKGAPCLRGSISLLH